MGDVPDYLVYDVVALDEQLRRLAVAGQQGVGGAGDAFADQGEHLGEEPVHLVRHRDGRPERLLHDQGPENGRCSLFLVRSFYPAHVATDPKRHARHVIGHGSAGVPVAARVPFRGYTPPLR